MCKLSNVQSFLFCSFGCSVLQKVRGRPDTKEDNCALQVGLFWTCSEVFASLPYYFVFFLETEFIVLYWYVMGRGESREKPLASIITIK